MTGSLLVSGCGTQDESLAPAGDLIQLLKVADFAEYLESNPTAELLNVHIPYDGHIAGTDEFVAFDEILDSERLPSDLDAPIALYCRSGNMSGQSAAALAAAGYTNIVDLDGGMNSWAAAGRELLTAEPEPS